MKKIFTFPLLTLACSSQLYADTELPHDDVLNTVHITRGKSVSVSATGFEQTHSNTPVSLSIITPEEIKATGASSLTEVLRTQAGIQLKDNIGDGSRSFISVRGFGANSANNVLIVVDGRKLNNPTLEAPLLSSISLKDIERIEIVQGSGGVLYGDQAVGGVINIITQKVSKDQLSLSVTHGTDDLKRHKIKLAKKFNNGVSFRLSGETKTADNFRVNNEANNDNIFAQLNYDADWGELTFERTHVDDKLNTPGFLSNSQISDDRRQLGSAGSFDHRVNVERLNAVLYLNDNLHLENSFSLRDSNGDVNSFGISSQDTRVKTYSSKLLGRWNTEHGDVLLTSGYEDIKSDYQNTGFASSDWVNTQESVYTQLVYPFTSRVSFAAGARYTQAKDFDFSGNRNLDESETAKELGVNYQLKNIRYFFRIAESFRFGNADENGRVLPTVKFLLPQTSTSYEAGFEHTSNTMRTNVLVYDLKIDDEIYFDGIASANVNLDSSARKGITVEIDKGLSDNLAVGLGASYIRAVYTAGNFQGSEVPSAANKTATAYIDYRLSKSLSIYFDLLYTGERYPDSDNANSSEKLGGYTISNFNLGWNKNASSVNFRVNNLGGKKYSGLLFSSGGYPAPERSVELTYAYTFE
jgi:iron complex outermembrane receptor protein